MGEGKRALALAWLVATTWSRNGNGQPPSTPEPPLPSAAEAPATDAALGSSKPEDEQPSEPSPPPAPPPPQHAPSEPAAPQPQPAAAAASAPAQSAQPPDWDTPYLAEPEHGPPEDQHATAHLHRFYVRAGLGAGRGRVDAKYNEATSAKSGTFVLDGLIGAKVIDRLILGAGYLSISIHPTPTFRVEAHGTQRAPPPDAMHVYLIGPFADAYYDPALGIHLGLLFGYARVHPRNQTYRGAYMLPDNPPFDTRGYGFALFGGYDFRFRDQLWLGLGLDYVRAQTRGSEFGFQAKATTNALGLVVTFVLRQPTPSAGSLQSSGQATVVP